MRLRGTGFHMCGQLVQNWSGRGHLSTLVALIRYNWICLKWSLYNTAFLICVEWVGDWLSFADMPLRGFGRLFSRFGRSETTTPTSGGSLSQGGRSQGDVDVNKASANIPLSVGSKCAHVHFLATTSYNCKWTGSVLYTAVCYIYILVYAGFISSSAVYLVTLVLSKNTKTNDTSLHYI